MTILDALQNALDLLESLGYTRGDIHDDLNLAITRLDRKDPQIAKEQL